MKKAEEVLNKFLDTKVEVVNNLQKATTYKEVVSELYKILKAQEEALKFAENQYTEIDYFRNSIIFKTFSSSTVFLRTPQFAKLYDALVEILGPNSNSIQNILDLVESYSNKK